MRDHAADGRSSEEPERDAAGRPTRDEVIRLLDAMDQALRGQRADGRVVAAESASFVVTRR